MKITQLEYFCAVSRYHSITQAAQKLYVTQPAISSAIRELEKEFSVNLFTRSKNHLTLTKEGEVFYRKASELLRQIDQTSQEFHDLGMEIAPLRIGIPPLLSIIFFPDMLLAFREKYPTIPIELFEYGSIRAASLIQDEELDLALVNMHFPDSANMNSFRLLTDRLVFCISRDHPLACKKEISIEQLSREPLILYNTDSVQNQTLLSFFDKLGTKPNILMHSSQLYTIKNFILGHLGGAILYSTVLAQHPDLVGIPISPCIEQDIGLIWKKGKYLNNSVEKFLSFTPKYAASKWMQPYL
ncbi:LysR family transcriptional regulator [Clostridium sp. Marseille-P3244]|uniref:LysR family transcriptional regulator n=1 Tax=Clostridium sp. Marseille-P3244 TaxID=1871020 RepID=UPI000930C522|nr:LysR family transcriptional regulator [Clostridium sp. Marseille-P3244]